MVQAELLPRVRNGDADSVNRCVEVGLGKGKEDELEDWD